MTSSFATKNWAHCVGVGRAAKGVWGRWDSYFTVKRHGHDSRWSGKHTQAVTDTAAICHLRCIAYIPTNFETSSDYLLLLESVFMIYLRSIQIESPTACRYRPTIMWHWIREVTPKWLIELTSWLPLNSTLSINQMGAHRPKHTKCRVCSTDSAKSWRHATPGRPLESWVCTPCYDKQLRDKLLAEGYTFKCEDCPKSYKDFSTLHIPITDHHRGQRLVCEVEACDKWYQNLRRLRGHMRAAHPELTVGLDEQPTKALPCTVKGCDLKAASKSGLISLVKSHDRDEERVAQVWLCTFCDHEPYGTK